MSVESLLDSVSRENAVYTLVRATRDDDVDRSPLVLSLYRKGIGLNPIIFGDKSSALRPVLAPVVDECVTVQSKAQWFDISASL